MNTDIIENLPGEEWRDIEGYEDLYQVSNKGRVKSLERYDNKNHLVKERIRKPVPSSYCYYVVSLSKNGKVKNYRINRLVAKAFLPNPNDYPMVNHIDENIHNNCLENLEWCSASYNTNYGTANERRSKAKSKKIKATNIKTKQVLYFKSGTSAAEYFCGKKCSTIRTILARKSIYKNEWYFEHVE